MLEHRLTFAFGIHDGDEPRQFGFQVQRNDENNKPNSILYAAGKGID